VTADGFEAPYALVERVGMLLISTLTSVKHAGAAFASRDSLQEISTACMSAEDSKRAKKLPELWVDRLLDEISLIEKVRDSTLRRSTGYALGFLAIMRSEMASKSGPSTLCPRVLEAIIMLSLPPEEKVKNAFEKLQLPDEVVAKPSTFFHSSTGSRRCFLQERDYEVCFD
jgi:hypothetical protein